MKLRCKLIASSDVEHLHQIYAGFAMLHRAGEIDLTQVIPDAALANKGSGDRWTDYRFFNTSVIIEDKLKVTYDTHDRAWMDPEILADSDLYFKRSFLPSETSLLEGSEKVHPLGLNMQVNDASRDMFRLRRARMYPFAQRLKTMMKAVRVDNTLRRPEPERLDMVEDVPREGLEPKVLFMARLWDPSRIESKIQSDAVRAMNESRAECITRLRKELGPRFLGGVSHDEYSRKYFPEALIEDASLSQKLNYLRLLKEFPICVATVGLNGSTGWKLAEYVAASKAIISEPLVYGVPGDFNAPKNYLEFRSTEELVENAVRLMDSRSVRSEMMHANRKYYLDHVRPDALVRNTLQIVSDHLAR